jgi:hypothetical protein
MNESLMTDDWDVCWLIDWASNLISSDIRALIDWGACWLID